MTKEQISFLVVLGLLAGIWFLGQSSEAAPRATRRGRAPDAVPTALALTPFRLSPEETSWSASGRNTFLAPRETKDLELRPLVPPPFPRLLHPGLPVGLPVGPKLATKQRHEIVPDATAKAAAPGKSATDTVASATDPESPESDLSQVDRSSVGLTLADRIRLTEEERLRRKEAERRSSLAEDDRKKGLDRVTWQSGEIAFGEVVEYEKKGPDRWLAKLEIERIRGDVVVSEADRRRALEAIKLVFKEDRGAGKARPRNNINGSLVQRIDFADTPRNSYGIRRHQVPAEDLAGNEDLAKFVFDAGEIQLAEDHLRGMKAKGLWSEKAAVLLADTQRKRYRYEREMEVLEEALATAPKSVPLLVRRGRLFLDLGLPERAREAFMAALEQDPQCPPAHLGLGETQVIAAQYDLALQSLKRLDGGGGLDRDQHAHALWLIGRCWLALGELGNSEAYFSRSVDRSGGEPWAQAGLVITALMGRGPAAARDILARAGTAHPNSGTLSFLSGIVALRERQFSEARSRLDLALSQDPVSAAWIHTALSYLAEATGDLEGALGAVELAAKADPSDQATQWQRARLLLAVGDLEQARTGFQWVLEREPDRADVLVALGDVAFRLGNPVEAARYYERAESLESSFPDLLGRRIVTEVRRRRLGDAETLLKRVDGPIERESFIQSATAYYHYSREKTEEVRRRLRLLIERKDPKPDPTLVAWAESSLNALEDDLNKEVWTDDFNRTGQILRGWQRVLSRGLNLALEDGRLLIQGTQKEISDDPTVLYQELNGRQFSSFSVDVALDPESGATKGVGLLAFNPTAKEPETYPGLQRRDGRLVPFIGLQVAMTPAGKLAYRTIQQSKATEWIDLPESVATGGGSVRIGIEVQDIQKSTYRILVNQVAAVSNLELPGLSKRPGKIELQLFAHALLDKPVRLAADNVTMITLKKS